MNKVFTGISIGILSTIAITPVLAITATPSATTTPTVTVTPTDNQVNSNLQDRIRNMVQQNVSTTEAKLKEKLNELSLVGYAGKVTAVTNSNLTLDSAGDILQVVTNDATSIVNAGQKVKFSSIAISDKLIVIGTLNSKKDIITSKRIVVVKDTASDIPTAYVGTIQGIDTKKRTLTLKTNSDSLTLILSKKANLKIEELKANSSVFVVTRVQDAGKVVTKIKTL